MSETLEQHGDTRSEEIAQLINRTVNAHLSKGVTLTDENLNEWVTELVSTALTTAAPAIWQMATDTVAEIFVSEDPEETAGLELTREQRLEAGLWIASWPAVHKFSDETPEEPAGE